ncbi:hypothetical protein E4420_15025 [Stenotrophomonas maltophilia]|uniref:hypothetical protein n=1 Tax=Stenotrophomonas maltophilia TaxID=40324 RepID=UPI0011108A38|nr:hypothetical protein [Stenotrophomonas maltophilia]TIL18461.1 hypothetical protein E4420_15025 [Stenotrophomonas maltophilia]
MRANCWRAEGGYCRPLAGNIRICDCRPAAGTTDQEKRRLAPAFSVSAEIAAVLFVHCEAGQDARELLAR